MVLPALCVYLFPARMLSSAIGLGVMVARLGAFAGPLVGQFVLDAGASPQDFFLVAAIPAGLCALFAFIVYFNLLNLGQAWVASGRWSLAGFLLALHGGTLLLAGLWLAKQHNNWSVSPWRRQRAAALP